MTHKNKNLLGDYLSSKERGSDLGPLFQKFYQTQFAQLNAQEQTDYVSRALCDWIQNQKEPCFLLKPVLEFIARIEKENILEHYTFTSFELWLNEHSKLTIEENRRIRAKIVGKLIERSDYEALFPIGMGKMYQGSHFVTAHKSPDLDTTVASFWGWMDAFGARVSQGLHIWNVPGGPPSSQVEVKWLFSDLFGSALFTHLVQTRSALNLNGRDLLSLKGILFKKSSDSIGMIDHEREHHPVIVLDDAGRYLGDWRSSDVEGVQQLILLFSSCLRWFENKSYLRWISLFAKKKLHISEVETLMRELFFLTLEKSEPVLEFNSRQKEQIELFLCSVLKVEKGLKSSFEQLGSHLSLLADVCFPRFNELIQGVRELFDSDGYLIEDRSRIFAFMKKEIETLHSVIFHIRRRLEWLDIALATKIEVFGHRPTSITLRSDLEEIQAKMGSYYSLTVNQVDQQGNLFPLGVVYASDLRKNFLGTVSLRDFCNRDEMTIPSYLDVISVIDHHKSAISTLAPPMALIADVQSSNSLVASRAFLINDSYSMGGQTIEVVDKLISQYNQDRSPQAIRLTQRLLKRQLAAHRTDSFFIDPEREFIEYLHFLYAILDDTDLLSKVSSFDVECVVSLLNRLKSLQLKQEVEVLSLDDIPRGQQFAKLAAQRILQNEEMYSLYAKVYSHREEEMMRNIESASQNLPSYLFADTKEQNGCCRVGQTKLFVKNFPSFLLHADQIRRVWLDAALQVYQKKSEIDLHIHMISTVVDAEQVYLGRSISYPHKDELWFWVAQDELAFEHLRRFLSAFASLPTLKGGELEVEFCGANGGELSSLFKESFLDIPQSWSNKKLPLAILRFKAGLLNSRKAMVSPFLPNLKGDTRST